MRQQVYETIARSLEEKIRADAEYRPPAITELARHHHVAYQTMWKAVRLLVKKGLLATAPGKKLARASRDSELATSSEKLYQVVKQRIESGAYQVGKPYPKVDYFVVTEHVSPLTATRVFRRLADEKLAHQSRRRWLVGPAPVRPSALRSRESSMSSSPIAMIIYSDAQDWSQLLQTSFVNSFIHPFTNELLAHHILIAPGFFYRAGDKGIAAPTEMDEIIAYIRRLGSRYVGTVVHAVFPREEKMEERFAALVGLGKPVIHFDSADRGAYITRQLLGAKKLYFRLHQDERLAVRMALEALTARGHRVIGIHGQEIGGWWSERRTNAFRELAREFDPAPAIVTSGPFESAWGFESHLAMHDFITTIAGKAHIEDPFGDADPKAKRHFRRLLIENAPSLVSMLVDHKPTVIAALLDRMAREYHFWLQALGIMVPQQLSLISFDNSPETSFFPITSIDWGFAQLAYLAAHIMIGDIPIKTNRYGHIAGACRLVDRGSIGPAPDDAAMADMLSKLRI